MGMGTWITAGPYLWPVGLDRMAHAAHRNTVGCSSLFLSHTYIHLLRIHIGVGIWCCRDATNRLQDSRGHTKLLPTFLAWFAVFPHLFVPWYAAPKCRPKVAWTWFHDRPLPQATFPETACCGVRPHGCPCTPSALSAAAFVQCSNLITEKECLPRSTWHGGGPGAFKKSTANSKALPASNDSSRLSRGCEGWWVLRTLQCAVQFS